jgi:predicted flavoprotein YhiN
MTGTTLKMEIIESIIKTEDDALLNDIKSLIEEDSDNEPFAKGASLLGGVDWDELQEQLNTLHEPSYTWEELMSEIKKARK